MEDAKLQRDEGCHDSGAVAVALEAGPTAHLTHEVARFEKRGELGVEESSHIGLQGESSSIFVRGTPPAAPLP